MDIRKHHNMYSVTFYDYDLSKEYIENRIQSNRLIHTADLYAHRNNGLPSWINRTMSAFDYSFMVHNKAHRYCGPAWFRWHNGMKDIIIATWHINGTSVVAEEYFTFLDEAGIDINNISDNDKLLITMWVPSDE